MRQRRNTTMAISKIEIEALGRRYLDIILQDGKPFEECLDEGDRLLEGLSESDARAAACDHTR
jgi:hypothetical protein